MFNKNKLKAKMLSVNKDSDEIARALGISPVTFYRKMNNDGSFYRNEILIMSTVLGLTDDEIKEIFFAERLA